MTTCTKCGGNLSGPFCSSCGQPAPTIASPIPEPAVPAASPPDAPASTVDGDHQGSRTKVRRAGLRAAVAVLVAAGGAFWVGSRAGGDSTAAIQTLPLDTTTTSSTTTAGDEPATSAPAAPETATTVTPQTEAVSLTITVPAGTDAPPMPTQLNGWKQVGPLRSTQVRVFDSQEYSYPPEIGPSTNSCRDGFWTARWRVLNPAVVVRTTPFFTALAQESADPVGEPAFPEAVGARGAGYISGQICETPIFGWVSGGSDGSTLADIVVEWQEWEPAV